MKILLWQRRIALIFVLIGVVVCQNSYALRVPIRQKYKFIEKATASDEEKGYAFMPGELLQFDGKHSVLLTGDYGSGKSALAIKILDSDEKWKCVSCGASDVRFDKEKKVILGKRRTGENVIFSRILGKRQVPLSKEKIVTIKWIIALDDTPEAFLERAKDYGITIIKIDRSDVHRNFSQLLGRINNVISERETKASLEDKTPQTLADKFEQEKRGALKFSEEKAPNTRGERIYGQISKAMREYIAVRREAIKNGGYFKTIKVLDDNGNYIEARVWTKIRLSDFMLSRFILTIEKIMHRMKREPFTKL